MRHLKTLSGTGTVAVDGADIGQANYSIEIYDNGNVRGIGRFETTKELMTAMMGDDGDLSLQLEDGSSVAFVFTTSPQAAQSLHFETTGPIPGI